MGVRIQCNIAAIPAGFKDSQLRFSVGSKDYKIAIEGIKTLEFPLQCNHFINPSIFAYMIGEKYSMVLRYDGTGCVFTNKGHYICRNINLGHPVVIDEFFNSKGGAYVVNREYRHTPIELFTDGAGNYILTAEDVPVSVTFKEEENLFYLRDLAICKSDAYPEVKMVDGKLYAIGPSGQQVYEIFGNISKSKAFTVFVGGWYAEMC